MKIYKWQIFCGHILIEGVLIMQMSTNAKPV